MISPEEFSQQVLQHSRKIKDHFGVTPKFFRNTELIYNNDLGATISAMGFRGMITDGIESILHNRSPHNVFAHPDIDDFKILVRNYRLSDDIAFRYSQEDLPVEKYLYWLSRIPADQPLVALAMDYETFGEHKKSNTGIHTFLDKLLTGIARSDDYKMSTASEAIETIGPHSMLFVPQFVSWADRERDLSAWLGNDMQRDAFDSIKRLEKKVRLLNDEDLLEIWRHFQTSDHFYYMSTKNEGDGSVHSYFSPYVSPYEAFINYMNVVSDFSLQVKKQLQQKRKSEVKRPQPTRNSIQF
jgi:alpha-amylase